MKTIPSLASLLILAGCSHVPPGGASAVHVSFSIPAVFSITKDVRDIKVTQTKITAGESSTNIKILLFQWDSLAKDVVLTNPPKTSP